MGAVGTLFSLSMLLWVVVGILIGWVYHTARG